jgi:hypothetical protein
MACFHGVPAKSLPNGLGWRRALEAWETGPPANSILAAIAIGPSQQKTLYAPTIACG